MLGDAREGLPLPLGLALPKELVLPIGLPTPPIGEGGEGLWDPLKPLQPPLSGEPDSSLKILDKFHQSMITPLKPPGHLEQPPELLVLGDGFKTLHQVAPHHRVFWVS